MSLSGALRKATRILLDFDGPVCAIYGGISDRAVADSLRRVVYAFTRTMPPDVESSGDPLDVFRYAAQVGSECVYAVELELAAQETLAVITAPATRGARAALVCFKQRGQPVTIVSNNSEHAIAVYLARSGLAGYVSDVVGREPGEPEFLKPDPYLIDVAIQRAEGTPDDFIMIGDSSSDIEAASAAGVRSIAYVNKEYKRARFEALRPVALIESMADISVALGVNSR